MTAFLLIATVLALVAAGAAAIPLLRKNSASPKPAVWAALCAAAVLIFGAAGLYMTWSHWSWPAGAAGDTPERMVSRLARRLEKNPQDLDGWLRLGRSYSVLQQYPLAARAYQKASQLAGGKNAEALIGLGEALISNDGRMPEGKAGTLFEQALELKPNHPKALWYAGLTAFQAGRLDIARDHWAALVALNPPPQIKQLLEAKVAELDRQLQKP